MTSKRLYLRILYLFLGILFTSIQAAKITTEIAVNNFNSIVTKSCSSIGYDYFDSSLLSCLKCPTNQTANSLLIDGAGNYEGCTCKQGSEAVSTSNCTGVSVISAVIPLCFHSKFLSSLFS
jgi:hypothetical protein